MKLQRSIMIFIAIPCILATGAVALGDEAAMLQRLHGAIVNPDQVISEERGEKTREFLDGRSISADGKSGDEKIALLQLEVFAELARGNAAAAAKQLEQLATLKPDDVLTHKAGYLVGVASGNAELADRSLSRLASEAAERDSLRTQARQVTVMARKFPDHDVFPKSDASSGESEVAVRVIDLWSAGDGDNAMRDAALARAFADYGEKKNVQFIGVCADVETTGKSVAASTRRRWPQHYRESGAFEAVKSELALEATPTLLIVDGKGWIRSAASATDPAFHYALRAVVHEASGKFEKNAPRDRAGLAAYAVGETAAPKKIAAPEQPPAPALTNSPEAEKLLERARLFTRTGKKNDAKAILQQILDEYPNTIQAEEAESRLRSL
ncbi:MAG: hypothetical protein AB7N71_10585 [Phycisphaerae bacterium]